MHVHKTAPGLLEGCVATTQNDGGLGGDGGRTRWGLRAQGRESDTGKRVRVGCGGREMGNIQTQSKNPL